MNSEEHKIYLEEFSALTEKILLSEKSTTKFLVDAKINTPSGRLTRIYSKKTPSIGFRIQKK